MRQALQGAVLLLAAVTGAAAGAAAAPKPLVEIPAAGSKAVVPAVKPGPVLDSRVKLGSGGVLLLRGKRLGKAPAGRVVVLRLAEGRRLLLKVRRWTPTRIEAVLPGAMRRRAVKGRLHIAHRSSPDRPLSNVIRLALPSAGTGTGSGAKGALRPADGVRAAGRTGSLAGGSAGVARAPGARGGPAASIPIEGGLGAKRIGGELAAGRMAVPGRGAPLPGGMPCPPARPGTPLPPGCRGAGLPREPRPGEADGLAGIHMTSGIRIEDVRHASGRRAYRYQGRLREYSAATLRQCIPLDPDGATTLALSGRQLLNLRRAGARAMLVPARGSGGWPLSVVRWNDTALQVEVPNDVARQAWAQPNPAFFVRFLEGGRTLAQSPRFDVCRTRYQARVEVRFENCLVDPVGPTDVGVMVLGSDGFLIRRLGGTRWTWNERTRTATATVEVPEGERLAAELYYFESGRCRGGSWERTRIEIAPRTHRRPTANVVLRHVTPIHEQRIALDFLTTVLNVAVFQSFRVRIDNYDPSGRSGPRWHRPNGSTIEAQVLTPDGSRVPLSTRFDLDELQVEALGTWYYYVQDINSRRAVLGAYPRGLTLTLEFESDGTEIKGRCVGCAIGDDAGAPDAELDEGRVVIRFPIVFKRGADPARIGPGVDANGIRAEVDFRFDLHGIVSYAPGVSGVINRWIEREIERRQAAELVQWLRREAVQESLDRMIREAVQGVLTVRGYTVLRYVDTRLEGGDLVVRFIGTRRR